MSLDQKNISLAFLATLLMTLFGPVILHNLSLIFFSPFLIILYYNKSYIRCLQASLGCGLILDLLSSQMHIGLQALSFFLTTSVLYNFRYNFFADSLSTLPIMTFLFSFITTIIQCILIYTLEKEVVISWGWVFTDLFMMPAYDGLFAFIWFILPFFVFGKKIRRGKDYFYKEF